MKINDSLINDVCVGEKIIKLIKDGSVIDPEVINFVR